MVFGHVELEDVEVDVDVDVDVEVELTTFGRETHQIFYFWTRVVKLLKGDLDAYSVT